MEVIYTFILLVFTACLNSGTDHVLNSTLWLKGGKEACIVASRPHHSAFFFFQKYIFTGMSYILISKVLFLIIICNIKYARKFHKVIYMKCLWPLWKLISSCANTWIGKVHILFMKVISLHQEIGTMPAHLMDCSHNVYHKGVMIAVRKFRLYFCI